MTAQEPPLIAATAELPFKVNRRALAGALLLVLLLSITGACLVRKWSIPLPCLLRDYIGVPCPFCGGTRALAAMAIGDFRRAFEWNPLVAAGFWAGLVSCVALLVGGGRAASIDRVPKWLVVALLAANWVYLMLFLPQ